MKANKDKCHLTVSNDEHVSIKIDDKNVENSDCQKLLGIKSDPNLSFKDHLDGVIKKVNLKVGVFSCITPYMNIAKLPCQKEAIDELVFFILFTWFNYCPLILMLHSHGLNNKINCA